MNLRMMKMRTVVAMSLLQVAAGCRWSDAWPRDPREVAAAALVTPTLVFDPPEERYRLENLDHAMNSGIAMTRGGRIYSSWVAGEDGPRAFLVQQHSDDGGKTWSGVDFVVDPHVRETPGDPIVSITSNFWLDPQGRLHYFFDQGMGLIACDRGPTDHMDGRAGVWESVCENPDAAKPSWSTPRRIGDGHALSKPTVARDGTWYLPVCLNKTGIPAYQAAFADLDSRRGVNIYASTDAGRTWQLRGICPFPQVDWHEPKLVELKDGRLWLLSRVCQREQQRGIMQSFSSDGGRTWEKATYPAINNPVARFELMRLASGRLLFVCHGRPEEWRGRRDALTAWLSNDDGKTWCGGLVLDGRDNVSYPDAFQAADGSIYVQWDHLRRRGQILFARFTEEDVLAGRFVSPGHVDRGLVADVSGAADPFMSLGIAGLANLRRSLSKDGVTEVSYELRPTRESLIRCVLSLPPRDKWNGRFLGHGHGGRAGTVNANLASGSARRGWAAAHTDMGSSRGLLSPDAVTDFGHRATHLMTTSAKAMTEAFYGRKIAHSYFSGWSTGGGQGFHEAIRYPEDYDGIVSGVPANARLPLHIYVAWNWRQTHDADGRELFSKEEFEAVQKAALDWMAPNSPDFARKRFPWDSRWSAEGEKAILDAAAKSCPSLAEGDKRLRLERMFRGPEIGGRKVHGGVPFGAEFADGFAHQWLLEWWLKSTRSKSGVNTVTDDELLQWEKDWALQLNACSADLDAFFDRGGKLLVYGGSADATVPYCSMIDWYEKAKLRAPEKVAKGCRFYIIPGRRHTPVGKVICIDDAEGLMVNWVEKGVAPEKVSLQVNGLRPFAIRPYPDCFAF